MSIERSDAQRELWRRDGIALYAEHPGVAVGRVRHLLDVLEKYEERDGKCICDTGPGTEGPVEDCPRHGRPYSEWVERFTTANARLNMVNTLVQVWRARKAKPAGFYHEAHAEADGRDDATEQCADELAEALAAVPQFLLAGSIQIGGMKLEPGQATMPDGKVVYW